MAIQSLVLRVPAIRSALSIPVRQAGASMKTASLLDSINALKKFFNDKKAEALLQAKNKSHRDARRR